MNWKMNSFDKALDFLKFLGIACLVIDGIFAAVFTVWFSGNFFWHLYGYLARVWFAHNW